MKERIQHEPAKKKHRDRYSYARGLYAKFTDGAYHPIRAVIRLAQKEIRIFKAFYKKMVRAEWKRGGKR